MDNLSRDTIPNQKQYPERILQFGGGNFLRAFSNWMFEILNEETNFSSSIIIVKPTPRGDYTALRVQEGLYHVILNGLANGHLKTEQRLIQNISRIIHPYKEWNAFLATAELEEIRFIISNTTESGITYEAGISFETETVPLNFPAKLTHWLYRRFLHFDGATDKACIFLPCELIIQNGQQLKKCILQYTADWNLGTAFENWVETSNVFCDTLVDRIVSGFPSNAAEETQEALGFKDALMVEGEAYHSWIIKADTSVQKALPFSKTGLNVRFVEDLDIHRQIKVRLLNGAHTALVPTAYLAGYRYVFEAISDPRVKKFINALLLDEVIPTIDHPKADLEAFAEAVIQRFENPSIQHKLLSIALNSTTKFKIRLLPSLLVYYQKHQRLPKRIIFALAALIHFYRGHWKAEEIPLKDDLKHIQYFQEAWGEYKEDYAALAQRILAYTDLWGQDLNEVTGFTNSLTYALDRQDFFEL